MKHDKIIFDHYKKNKNYHDLNIKITLYIIGLTGLMKLLLNLFSIVKVKVITFSRFI
jgi:hypothetical protein